VLRIEARIVMRELPRAGARLAGFGAVTRPNTKSNTRIDGTVDSNLVDHGNYL